MKVTKESIIGDVLDYDRGTAEFFLAIGMHCLGCPASRGESIEAACNVHGTNADELVEKLKMVCEIEGDYTYYNWGKEYTENKYAKYNLSSSMP